MSFPERTKSDTAAPTFRSCQTPPPPRPLRISSGRSDSSFSSPEFSSSNTGMPHSPPLLPSNIRSELKAERCYERKWKVAEEWRCIPCVPPFYVLSLTKTTVMGGSSAANSPADVACRIVDSLRLLNLDAAYDHSRAVALATSSDGVEFFVRLFRHGSERGIIVEIQKKRGSALRFHRMAKEVLRDARGDMTARREMTAPKPDAPSRSSPIGGSPLLGRTPSLSHQFLQPQLSAPPMDAIQDPKYSTAAALETVDALLRKDRTAAQELGMESLALLTDEESSGTERALGVAQVLLLGLKSKNDGSEEERFSSVRQKMVDLIVNRHVEEEMNDYERNHLTAMRRLAMTALGNSLTILSRSSPAVTSNRVSSQAGFLVSALMEDVERAEQFPHDAALAVQCLSALLSFGAAAMMACKAADEEMREKLTMARGVGRCRHSMLERESERAILRLL